MSDVRNFRINLMTRLDRRLESKPFKGTLEQVKVECQEFLKIRKATHGSLLGEMKVLAVTDCEVIYCCY